MRSAKVAACIVLATLIAAAPAVAARVRHVHLRPAGHAFSLLARGGPYVFLGDESEQGGTLIDERTNTRTEIQRSGCSVRGMGGAWLLFECGHLHPLLYGLGDGQWRPVALDPGFARDEMNSFDTWTITDVGTHWLELTLGCYHCGAQNSSFQNIDDGRVVGDPTTRRTVADLSSPKLARRVCPPLRLTVTPGSFDSPGPTYGTLDMAGPFGLLGGGAKVYLQRCGSRVRHLVCGGYCDPVLNRHAVVWASGRRLTEVRLPSLETFSIPLPRGAGLPTLALTARTLYVLSGRGTLYTAPASRL